jgi:hypothetical protein
VVSLKLDTYSIVIPGNPGEGQGRPEIQEFQIHLDTGWS